MAITDKLIADIIHPAKTWARLTKIDIQELIDKAQSEGGRRSAEPASGQYAAHSVCLHLCK